MAYKIVSTITPKIRHKEVSIQSLITLFSDHTLWGKEGQFFKIEAIKKARIVFALGLKDAKFLVEEFMDMVFSKNHEVSGDVSLTHEFKGSNYNSPHESEYDLNHNDDPYGNFSDSDNFPFDR